MWKEKCDRSHPKEAMHLLDLFVKNIEDQLLVFAIVNMMRIVAWCLQNDFTKMPSMSMVVKVFEGVMNVESDLDYFFSNSHLLNTRARVDNQEVHVVVTIPLLPSILSRPR